MGSLQLNSYVLHRMGRHHDRSPLRTADVAQLHLCSRMHAQRHVGVRFRVLQGAAVNVERSGRFNSFSLFRMLRRQLGQPGVLQRDSTVLKVVHLKFLGMHVELVGVSIHANIYGRFKLQICHEKVTVSSGYYLEDDRFPSVAYHASVVVGHVASPDSG